MDDPAAVGQRHAGSYRVTKHGPGAAVDGVYDGIEVFGGPPRG